MKKKERRHGRYVLFDLNGTNNKNETSSVFFSFVDYYSVFFFVLIKFSCSQSKHWK